MEVAWKFAGVCAWTTGAPRITVEMIAMSGDFFIWHISSIELAKDFYRSEYFAHTSICNRHGDVNYWLGLPALAGLRLFWRTYARVVGPSVRPCRSSPAH